MNRITRCKKALSPALGLLLLAVLPGMSHAGVNSTPIPEPDTIALFSLGVIVAAIIKKAGKK